MSSNIKPEFVQSAVNWSLLHGLALKTGDGSADHCALSMSPVRIHQEHFSELKKAVALMGKMLHAISEDHAFLEKSLNVLASGDILFDHLLKLHSQIHQASTPARRQPLLIMRTDFMDDASLGPKVIEFNGIAAGMGPFGEKAHQLHRYLQSTQPEAFNHWMGENATQLISNVATTELAKGIAEAAISIRQQRSDKGQPVFMMIVQPDEDNVYDQLLLEMALQALGIKTVRRTFRQLHDELSTGEGDRLELKGVGTVDVVYLRAGYQAEDFIAHDIEESYCCEALGQTRAFIEQHHVAMNATISQQLATSKRIQMLITGMSAEELTRFDLTLDEATLVKDFLGEMNPVDEHSYDWFKRQDASDWVLKNQGEGGGHCVFDKNIAPRLKELHQNPEQYDTWTLMRRLKPLHRQHPALLVRKGQASIVDDLISEIGLFTVHFNGRPMTDAEGYAGYLVRSKPSGVTEGGVHSGSGVVDSLAYLD